MRMGSLRNDGSRRTMGTSVQCVISAPSTKAGLDIRQSETRASTPFNPLMQPTGQRRPAADQAR
jgi:hypothetical protein